MIDYRKGRWCDRVRRKIIEEGVGVIEYRL